MKAAQSVARKMSETQREQRARGRGAQPRVKVPSDQACVFFLPPAVKKKTRSQVRINPTGKNLTCKFGAFRSVTEVHPNLLLRIALGIQYN